MPKRKRGEDEGRLFCICRLPNDPDRMMVECDCCQEWYHPLCLNLEEEDIDTTKEWICPPCLEILIENPMLKHSDISRLQGRVVPEVGWSNAVVLTIFTADFIEFWASSLRNRIEGYKIWVAGNVSNYQSNLLTNALYFKFHVKASMKPQQYNVYICFSVNGDKAKWLNCGCPAGVEGKCKHVIACLYGLQHYVLSGITEFPDAEAPTERRQVWHIRKPVYRETSVLFQDHTIEKVIPGKDKRPVAQNIQKYLKRCDVSKSVTKEALSTFAESLSQFNMPAIATISSNDFLPVQKRIVTLDSTVSRAIFQNMQKISLKSTSDYTDQILLYSNFYKSVIQINFEQAEKLEEVTRAQSRSSSWKRSRYYRITASNFKTYCHLRSTTNPVVTHKQLHRSRRQSFAEQHGKFYESVAIKKLLDFLLISDDATHSPVGLIVHPSLPYLGASPDYALLQNGIVTLVEVKCPYSLFKKKQSIADAAKGAGFHLTTNSSGEFEINKKTSTYYQIQAQLNITNTDSAILCVFVPPEEMVHVIVNRDIDFFASCVRNISEIYFYNLLPSFSIDA